MMFITPEQLEQLEFLLDQSTQGIHHLFEHRHIEDVLSEDGDLPFSSGEVKMVQKLLNRLLVQPTITLKRAFISRLSDEEKRLLLRSYFNIVENTIYDATSELH